MGSKTNAAVAARQQAQDRWAALMVERAARDRRIEDAAAAVIDAAGRLAAIRSQGELDRAAALTDYQATKATIDQAEADAVRAAEPGVAAGLALLTAEGVKAADIAALTGLPLPEVRRLTVRAAAGAPPANKPAPTSPAADVGSGVVADGE